MEDNRAEQVEALEALEDYNPRLIKAMKAVALELKGTRQPDTDEYLQSVINGINWEIQVLNGTMSVINENTKQIDKEETNQIFVEFSKIYQNKKDAELAECIEIKIIPFFEKLGEAAQVK